MGFVSSVREPCPLLLCHPMSEICCSIHFVQFFSCFKRKSNYSTPSWLEVEIDITKLKMSLLKDWLLKKPQIHKNARKNRAWNLLIVRSKRMTSMYPKSVSSVPPCLRPEVHTRPSSKLYWSKTQKPPSALRAGAGTLPWCQ